MKTSDKLRKTIRYYPRGNEAALLEILTEVLELEATPKPEHTPNAMLEKLLLEIHRLEESESEWKSRAHSLRSQIEKIRHDNQFKQPESEFKPEPEEPQEREGPITKLRKILS